MPGPSHAIIESEVLMPDELNRRDFLKAAAIATGPAVLTARGANDKVNIGWIGVGTRGYASLDWMHTAAPNDVKITAICDTYQGYIARAKDRMQTSGGALPPPTWTTTSCWPTSPSTQSSS